MNKCSCGSYAINNHLHGRDGSRGDLCDVCYWRNKYSMLLTSAENILTYLESDKCIIVGFDIPDNIYEPFNRAVMGGK